MADAPIRQSALEGVLSPGTFGADFTGTAPLSLQERRGLAIVQLACWEAPSEALLKTLADFSGFAVTGKPMEAAGTDYLRLNWISAHRWLLVADARPALADALSQAMAGHPVAITDLSHARTVVRLEGQRARQLLAKGSSVDMQEGAFKPDETRATALGHFNCLIDCHGPNNFDIHFMRSFAVSGWEWLQHAAEPEGFEISA